jgi:hypothetical protein
MTTEWMFIVAAYSFQVAVLLWSLPKQVTQDSLVLSLDSVGTMNLGCMYQRVTINLGLPLAMDILQA